MAEPWAQSVDEDIELALGAAEAAAGGTHTARAAAAAPVADVATTRYGGPDAALQPLAELFGGDKGWDPTGLGEAAAAASGALKGRWGWLAALAREAYGLPRHLSQHPGGMIVSTRPLIDCVPLVPAAMEGRQICQWDKDSCADAGFLKIDLLGLGMLSAVERCVEEIARTRNERIDLSRIPFDDPPTYDGDPGGRHDGRLPDREPRADAVAAAHAAGDAGRPHDPGRDRAAGADRRRRGQPVHRAQAAACARTRTTEVPYEHPSLEPVLRDTLGTIIFQDQVLEVAMAFAGFSPGEAEGLRRAMSRKRSAAAIEAYHERFIAGAARAHGADRETAERVFTMIAGFSGFGFPKAHGAAFGLLAYQSTWLRVHYKPEFTCALLNEQPMGFYPVGHAGPRGAADAGSRCCRPTSTAPRVLCHVEGPRADPRRPRLPQRRARRRGGGDRGRARGRAGRSRRWRRWRRARGRAGRRCAILAWAAPATR